MNYQVPDPLFSEIELDAYLNTKWASVDALVAQVSPADVLAAGAPALAQGIVGQVRIDPLVLDMSGVQKTFSPVTLMVTARPAYGEFDRGPVPQDGHQLTVVIPFAGDPLLWGARPPGINTGTGLVPRATVDAAQHTVTLIFAHTDAPDSNWYVRKLDEMLQRIGVFINLQNAMLDQQHAVLHSMLLQTLAKI